MYKGLQSRQQGYTGTPWKIWKAACRQVEAFGSLLQRSAELEQSLAQTSLNQSLQKTRASRQALNARLSLSAP